MELNQRITKVENDNRHLTEKVRKLEDKMLEGNVIFQGIPDSTWEPSTTTKEKVLTALAHTISGTSMEDKLEQAGRIPIKNVSRIGKYSAMRNRPVLVEFYYKSDCEFLLSNKKHLPERVYVDKQYCEETEKIRRKLSPILSAARKNDIYKGKCKMEGSTLIIKGRNYTTSNLHDLPTDISGFHVTSKFTPDTLGFYGELNPLSNFHPAPFQINGQYYHSSEQFIQQQKCIMFGDKETERQVMLCETPLECKAVARDVKNYDHECWKQESKASCTPGILAKFEQNPSLSHLLACTGTKTLVECSKDKHWGTGIPLYEENCLDRTKWTSQGLLGEILESVRNVVTTPVARMDIGQDMEVQTSMNTPLNPP